MPITAQELAAIAPDALALGKELVAAFGKASDGGKKLTKRERKAIAKKLLSLGVRLGVDIVD